MQISRTEEHGLRLVTRLAAEGGQLTVGEMAAIEEIPEPTVAKVLLALRRAGLVRAVRGRNGGYRLAAEAHEITVSRVLEALGQPLFEGRFCRSLDSDSEMSCPHDAGCGIRPVWQHIESLIVSVLEKTTLSDLLAGEESVREHVGEVLGNELGRRDRRLPVLVVDERNAPSARGIKELE